MTCTACGEHPKENTAKGFPKAVVEINNPETLVLLRKVVIPASMGDETAFPPAIGKYFNVLLHYEASGNNYLYSSDGIPTEIGANIPPEVLDRIKTLEDGYDDLAEDYERLQSQIGDVSEDLSAETSARELADGNLQSQVGNVSEALSAETSARRNADIGLQGQIDAITSSSDVKDIVGTYTELQNYDTSTLGNDDIIKVLQDSTHNNAMTYYRWIISGGAGSWQYIGEEGPYYTKSEADALLDSKQNVIADLPQIRSGAEAGATAVQPEDLATIATTGSYNDSLDKPSINNVELEGNKSLSDLGIVALDEFYKAFPTDTASGAVASFTDGADDLPLKSLVIDINPVQDLHGQDAPYPAGGGKNLFNGTFLQGYWAYADGGWVNSNGWIATDKTPCKPSTSYTVSADAKLTRWQGFVWYDANGNYISTDNLQSNENIGLTKTSPNNAYYLVFNIAGYPTSTDPISPSDVTHFQLEEGQTATSYAPYSNICPISGYSEAKVYVSPTQDAQDATVYTIDLDGARYGGTLDVTTGKLTVDRAMVDLGTKNWYPSPAAGRTRFRTSITDIERISSPNVRASLLCSNYPTKTANQTYQGTTGVSLRQNSADIYIYDPQTESMTTAEFKSAMSGVQLCYELATPIVYDLTPTEVKTLLGANNIFADTGDCSVEYRADTKLYIERLTAPDSADMVADANIVSGQYFMVGNSLYKATANIANGGQIIVGTNCTRVSLAQALNEINS